jgi:hypothetical protein
MSLSLVFIFCHLTNKQQLQLINKGGEKVVDSNTVLVKVRPFSCVPCLFFRTAIQLEN